MSRLALLLALCAAPALATASPSFQQWKAQWGRVYPSADEEALREAIFTVNAARVSAHNAAGHSWTLALNEFGDLTPAEFAAAHIGRSRPAARAPAPADDEDEAVTLPNEVDWTTKGAVTKPKVQGQCGACWAFAAVSTVESINEINGHGLITLSVQQLIDCAGAYGNQGCNGGSIDGAYRYIEANGGVCTEASYPYTASDGKCRRCTPVVKISGFKDIKKNSDIALATAVAQQPVAVVLEADQSAFQFYSSGVLTGPCGTSLDHEIMVVGYGDLAGIQYYKLQNEWGPSWGMDGYVLIARNESYNNGAGQCGIYGMGSYPVQ